VRTLKKSTSKSAPREGRVYRISVGFVTISVLSVNTYRCSTFRRYLRTQTFME